MADLFSSGITFIYFSDLRVACAELTQKFGFRQCVDYDYAVMFQIAQDAFIGAVNMKDEHKIAQKEKSATLCFTLGSVDKVREYHDACEKNGVEVSAVEKSPRLEYYCFKAQGPEGYTFEFGHFTLPEEAKYFNPQ